MTNGQDNPPEVTVEARVNAHAGWVELDPPRVRIPPGGEVVWEFVGVPNDLRPALLFLGFTPPPDHRTGSINPSLGPFRKLVRRGPEIRGSQERAVAGEYAYKVCLVSADEDNPLVHVLECRGVSAGGLVKDPGPARGGAA